MEKMNRVTNLIDEVNECAKNLMNIANNLQKLLILEKVEEQKEINITLEEVRRVLANKSNNGKTVQVRELIKKYGAERLSDVDKKYYFELMKEAEEL